MTHENKKHFDYVDAWIQQTTPGLSSPELVDYFEDTFCALWSKARATISAVMLVAILDRVHFNSIENHFLLSDIEIETTGVSFEKLRTSASQIKPAELTSAFGMMISEFLNIIGKLTNEVITQSLYTELSKVKSRTRPKPVHTDGEKT